MSAISVFVPFVNGEFGCLIAGGILIFMLSAYSSSAKAAARFQAVAFGFFTAGSVMVVKGLAEAYQR